MTLALSVILLVGLALGVDALSGVVAGRWRLLIARLRAPVTLLTVGADPGRDRRAEQRARELLRSCVSPEDWETYRRFGFIRAWSRTAGTHGGPDVAYLIYPHRPIVAYVPQTGRLLHEYCVTFPDLSLPAGGVRLPDADDVLAKWMALTGDEERLLNSANMHLPGRELDPAAIANDIWRLSQFEHARMRQAASNQYQPRGTSSHGQSFRAL